MALLLAGYGAGQVAPPKLDPSSPKKQGAFELLEIQRPPKGTDVSYPSGRSSMSHISRSLGRIYVIVHTEGVIQSNLNRFEGFTQNVVRSYSPSGLQATMVLADGQAVGLGWNVDASVRNPVPANVDVAVEIPEIYAPDLKSATIRLKSAKGETAEWRLNDWPATQVKTWASKPAQPVQETALGSIRCQPFEVRPRSERSFSPSPFTSAAETQVTFSNLDRKGIYQFRIGCEHPFGLLTSGVQVGSPVSGPSFTVPTGGGGNFSVFADKVRVFGELQKVSWHEETVDVPRATLDGLVDKPFAGKTPSGVAFSILKRMRFGDDPGPTPYQVAVLMDKPYDNYPTMTVSLDGQTFRPPIQAPATASFWPIGMGSLYLPQNGDTVHIRFKYTTVDKSAPFDLIVPRVSR